MQRWRVEGVLAMVTAMLVVGCAKQAPPAAAPPATTTATGSKPLTPPTISHGERVDLAANAVPGKTTIFDFSSQYCPPCQQLAPMLHGLHTRRDDLALVTVDINRPNVEGIDWRSPVAEQFKLRSIPHFVIYGPDGRQQMEGDAARDQVMAWLQN